MQVNARGERTGPFHHRRIEMRMRDRDGIDATESFDHRHGRVIKRGDAIPQDIAVFRACEQRALANGECRNRTDADNAFFVFAECIGMALPQRVKRGPRLPSRGNILPLFFTDHAMNWWLLALGMLRAAGGANVEGH